MWWSCFQSLDLILWAGSLCKHTLHGNLGGSFAPWNEASMDKTLFLRVRCGLEHPGKIHLHLIHRGSSGQDRVSAWLDLAVQMFPQNMAYPPGSRGITHYAAQSKQNPLCEKGRESQVALPAQLPIPPGLGPFPTLPRAPSKV